ncbi:MAG: hypothetical protein ACRC8W_16160 [Plesiomonas shigelloides]
MKISNDQNRIELDDGTVLVAKDPSFLCDGCFFVGDDGYCSNEEAPCIAATRSDELEKIFIKEQPNA